MIDHTDVLKHKDALNFVMNMIEEEDARRNLKAFLIVVTKAICGWRTPRWTS